MKGSAFLCRVSSNGKPENQPPSFHQPNELCNVFDVTLTELLNGERIESQNARIGKAEETILSLGIKRHEIIVSNVILKL